MMNPQNLLNYAGGALNTAVHYARNHPLNFASSVGVLVGIGGIAYGVFSFVTPPGNDLVIKNIDSQIKTQERSLQKLDTKTDVYWSLIGKNDYDSPEEYCENILQGRNQTERIDKLLCDAVESRPESINTLEELTEELDEIEFANRKNEAKGLSGVLGGGLIVLTSYLIYILSNYNLRGTGRIKTKPQ